MFQHVLTIALLCLSTTVMAGDNVVVVLDDSGSMQESMRNVRPRVTKMEAAKDALVQVLENVPADAQIGVVLLNDGWIIPLDSKMTKQQKLATIKSVQPSGGTPLGEYMKVGTDALLELRDKKHYGSYRLLVVTDGEANDSNLVNRYLPDIKSRNIRVEAIGVDMGNDHSLATKVHAYRRADDPESLKTAIEKVFAETTGNNNSGESDFEIVAEAFSEDLAAASLKALAEERNWPIGENQPVKVKLDEQGNIEFDQNGEVVVVEDTGSSDGGVGFLGFLGIIVVVGIVIMIFVMASKA